MFIGVMEKGDKVISVTSELIAIQRKTGEVDIIPLLKDETGLRVDTEGIVTIGYGTNTVQATVDDVIVTTF
jgi:hypothetical protein